MWAVDGDSNRRVSVKDYALEIRSAIGGAERIIC